jgi:hypothetical protein
LASHSGVELSRHITDEVAGAAAASARAQSSRPLPDAEDSYGAWTAIRRQLQAALQQIGALLRRDSLLTEKINRFGTAAIPDPGPSPLAIYLQGFRLLGPAPFPMSNLQSVLIFQ